MNKNDADIEDTEHILSVVKRGFVVYTLPCGSPERMSADREEWPLPANC